MSVATSNMKLIGAFLIKLWSAQAFVKKIQRNLKLCIDLTWREMRSKVIFGHPKWPPAAIL